MSGPAPCGSDARANQQACPHDNPPDRCLSCEEEKAMAWPLAQTDPNVRKGHPRFYEIQRELEGIHSQKAQAYEGTGEHYANYKAFARWVKAIQQHPEQAGLFYALLRLEEKLSRIQHVMEGATVGDEGIADTLNDMAIISTIARILYEESK